MAEEVICCRGCFIQLTDVNSLQAIPGNANLPVGVIASEAGAPKWHSRGYIPHFDDPAGIQHVTFHLADSLPKSVLVQMEQELKSIPLNRRDSERRKRIEEWIDAGHGSCVLRNPQIANMTEQSLLHFDGVRYRLLAWVVMPNHVHTLFQTINGWSMAKIVASWKVFTARKICEYRRLLDANLSIGDANREVGVPRKTPPVWHREYWDRYIRNDTHLQIAVEYIHRNPVKAGLIQNCEDWNWSSAYACRGTIESK